MGPIVGNAETLDSANPMINEGTLAGGSDDAAEPSGAVRLGSYDAGARLRSEDNAGGGRAGAAVDIAKNRSRGVRAFPFTADAAGSPRVSRAADPLPVGATSSTLLTVRTRNAQVRPMSPLLVNVSSPCSSQYLDCGAPASSIEQHEKTTEPSSHPTFPQSGTTDALPDYISALTCAAGFPTQHDRQFRLQRIAAAVTRTEGRIDAISAADALLASSTLRPQTPTASRGASEGGVTRE